jgi:hypothetical protein
MNIKTFIAAAVIALTAACTAEPEVVDVPVSEVNLNEDGSVAADVAEGSAEKLQLDSGEVRSREMSEGAPNEAP